VDDARVSLEAAMEILKGSRRVFVIPNDLRNMAISEEAFGGIATVEEVDATELNGILYGNGKELDANKIIKKYDRSIIVCLHGILAMDFALALREMGSRAYCLRGGADMLLRRIS
jgi:hypothetical protein